MQADMGRFGRGVGQRDGAIEGGVRRLGLAELLEQRALEAVEVK